MPRSETPLRSDLFPEISPYASGMLAVDGRHTIYWEQSGNPDGVPVRVPAWRPGRRLGAGASPLLRPAVLPHRRVRPARLRPLDAAGRAARQHHRRISSPTWSGCAAISASSAGCCSAARGAARWRWPMACPSRARARASSCAASSSARGTEIDWFLHGMRTIFPEAWRDFAEHLPAGRARRSAGQLLSPPDRPQSRPPSAGGARLEPLRGGLLDALSDGARAVRIRSRRLRPGAVAHRGALLRQRHVRARRLAVDGSRPHPPSAQHHRAGPLRHRLPAGDRRRAGARLARGALRRRARCRPQRAGARHPRGAGQRHRELPAVDQRRRPLRPAVSMGNVRGPRCRSSSRRSRPAPPPGMGRR